MPTAVIRADASATLGHGHVMRCLALATALRDQGIEVQFLLRRLPGDAVPAIEQAGFGWHRLPMSASTEEADAQACAEHLYGHGDADLLVLDHYQRGAAWVERLRSHARRVLVIDDLADRPLAGDLLLDQNWHDAPDERYAPVWPAGAASLFGPAHALLRSEFAAARATQAPRSGALQRVVIAFGGSDPLNATEACLSLLHAELPMLGFDVIVGSGSPHAGAILSRWNETPGVEVTVGAGDIARRFAAADLFIGAGGSMTWERACLGLPGITLPIAANQQPLCARLAAAGEGIDLQMFGAEALRRLVPAVQALMADEARVKAMGERLARRCDGLGVKRVAAAALEHALAG
ncbi:UDP-2,4-diacetamido-2,4,6-trideoxy-beta-L-altropyranose hydrolase [Aquabacterium sp.]|uniref:UDP-2,4-diacetamido-2,4, 6-trideoxy-beta-L-altropyranose hydrolase n=1 Tax=Aquabacterium sp. TaxID=1872578 RepID=UPI002BB374BC|nr:UDP-2,4-diacetamido-2,4,6-trideoxy-beta-L-altropyranose hydrolase [Aquabacterium sp.]HSW04735.1 UDP-2,4-diacetamido-2,4,6-trideoxy-beta-L-altropyranose hydrolase [Aquabacterium sp.]